MLCPSKAQHPVGKPKTAKKFELTFKLIGFNVCQYLLIMSDKLDVWLERDIGLIFSKFNQCPSCFEAKESSQKFQAVTCRIVPKKIYLI